MKKLVVIGSINMDVVTRVERFPRPGETLTGISFSTIPGGKGANQAVALGRLGMPVRMAGCVGDDAFGESYLRNFAENGVDTSLVRVRKGQTTGTATIEVNAEGENHIVVVPAANGECDMDWLEEILPAVADGDLFLLQHEIPLPVVHEAIRRLHAMGKTVILDPAPAAPVPEDVLAMVDYITPNESELRRHHPRAGQGRGRARAREVPARPGRGLRDQQVRRQWRLRGRARRGGRSCAGLQGQGGGHHRRGRHLQRRLRRRSGAGPAAA